MFTVSLCRNCARAEGKALKGDVILTIFSCMITKRKGLSSADVEGQHMLATEWVDSLFSRYGANSKRREELRKC